MEGVDKGLGNECRYMTPNNILTHKIRTGF